MTGRTISHYKVLEKLGQGAMGEVWKAEDLDLKRTVALKFLSREMLGEEEVKARLIREAQAAASLDHPNITTVHGIHEDAGETFIAMAYIDGPSLADKIKERPLPLEEALDVAVQIAEGLQEAHERKVVHRDIKPSNVMLDRRGRVKIMDFGLAAVADRTRLTKSGTTLGTPAYMSPEQAQGQAVDRRTDVWALGVVLHEMLTGKHPFPGDYEQAVVYSIINEDPEPITARRSGLPTAVDRIANRALAKEPSERYQHADEMLVDLRALRRDAERVETHRSTSTSPAGSASSRRSRPTRIRLVVAMAALLAASAVGMFIGMQVLAPEASSPLPLRRFTYAPAVPTAVLSISPNGKHIAYVPNERQGPIWVQDLDQSKPRALEGTDSVARFFWSRDSRFLVFAAELELKKVSVQGGPISVICDLPTQRFQGGTWSPDGESMVFSSGNPSKLHRIPTGGGTPTPLKVSEPDDEPVEYWGPQFLPRADGKEYLLYRKRGDVTLLNCETRVERILTQGFEPTYSPTGHVISQSGVVGGVLWAQPFSINELRFTGEAFPIAEDAFLPSVSDDGTLVYSSSSVSVTSRLVWKDRQGNTLGEIGEPQPNMSTPAISPDGRRIAVRALENGRHNIWAHDVDRPVKSRLTFDGVWDTSPVWSPTGSHLTFGSFRNENDNIYSKPTDGSGETRELVAAPVGENPRDWSSDEKYLLYRKRSVETNHDLWLLKRREDDSGYDPMPFLDTNFNETEGKFSPDGRFVAYVSDESGRPEVYVRPFPDGDVRWQVSHDGGRHVRWAKNGNEIFYVRGHTLIAASVREDPSFSVEGEEELFVIPEGRSSASHMYDISADGQRVVVVEPVGDSPTPTIHVVQNWYEEFRDRE